MGPARRARQPRVAFALRRRAPGVLPGCNGAQEPDPVTIGGGMKVVNCPCGERIEGETDDAVVEEVNAHLTSAHPEMAGKYSSEQILSMASEQ